MIYCRIPARCLSVCQKNPNRGVAEECDRGVNERGAAGEMAKGNSACISLQGLPLCFACKLLMQLLSAGIRPTTGAVSGQEAGHREALPRVLGSMRSIYCQPKSRHIGCLLGPCPASTASCAILRRVFAVVARGKLLIS